MKPRPSFPQAMLCGCALALSACGDSGSPSQPTPPPAAELELLPAQIDIASLNVAAPLTARLGTQSTSSPTISVVSENRWLTEASVLDPDSLARGTVFGRAPGQAVVNVSAFGKTKQLTVRVTHPRAAVLSAQAPSAIAENDTVTLRGYRLHENFGAVTFGAPLTVITRDSATLRLRVAASANSQGCTSAASDTLRITGADLLTSLIRPRLRAAELRLSIGEARVLDATAQSCLMLPVGTRYALAFLDTRAIEQAKLPRNQHKLINDYSVGVSPVTASATSSNFIDMSKDAPSDVDQNAATSADIYDPFSRATPWQLNEEFTVIPLLGAYPQMQVKVQRIYADHYVLASEAGMPADTLAPLLASLDSAFARFFRDAEGLYKSWFVPTMPRTSYGSGQLLVLLVRGCPFNVAGRAVTRNVDPRLPSSWVILSTCSLPRAAGSTNGEVLLLHELAHIWQFENEFAAVANGAPGTWDAWGIEGGADLAVNEVMRRRAGLSLNSNWIWNSVVFNDTPADIFARIAMATGLFTNGYTNAAGFLQHVVVSRVRAGATPDAAVTFVLRAALQGWYGQGFTGPVSSGFVAAMQTTDATWDPADALLRWTLSQAIDDMTSSTVFQNYTYFNVSRLHPQFGWRPSGEVLANGSTGVAVSRMQGSPGYLYLNNSTGPGTFTLTANVAGVKWMLVRYQ